VIVSYGGRVMQLHEGNGVPPLVSLLVVALISLYVVLCTVRRRA
jgi:hypothetical protein